MAGQPSPPQWPPPGQRPSPASAPPPLAYPYTPNKGLPVWALILMAGAPLIFFGGILSSLAIYGVRRYIAASKTAEANASLLQIGVGPPRRSGWSIGRATRGSRAWVSRSRSRSISGTRTARTARRARATASRPSRKGISAGTATTRRCGRRGRFRRPARWMSRSRRCRARSAETCAGPGSRRTSGVPTGSSPVATGTSRVPTGASLVPTRASSGPSGTSPFPPIYPSS